MRPPIALEPAPRRLERPPRWAVAVVLLWLASVAMIAWASSMAPVDAPELCRFKAITGVPCPTCGGTRAARAVFDGHVLEAVGWNPLLSVTAVVGVFWLVLRVGLGKRLVLTPGRSMPVVAWTALVVVAVALNWAYLIWRGV